MENVIMYRTTRNLVFKLQLSCVRFFHVSLFLQTYYSEIFNLIFLSQFKDSLSAQFKDSQSEQFKDP